MFEGIDYVSLLQAAVTNLMLTYSPEFLAFGQRVFLAAAALKLAALFVSMLMNPTVDHQYEAGKSILQIGIGYAMITFYRTPDPVLGVSLTGLIVDQMAAFTRILDIAVVTSVITTLDVILVRLLPPGTWLVGLADVIWYSVFFFVTLAKAASFVGAMFGMIIQACFVLLGPIFVGLYLIPRLNRLFWSWFDALLEYSFLPVMFFAYMMIGTHVLGAFSTSIPTDLTSDLYITWGGIILVFLIVYVLGFIGVPFANAALFRGVAGYIHTPMPRLSR